MTSQSFSSRLYASFSHMHLFHCPGMWNGENWNLYFWHKLLSEPPSCVQVQILHFFKIYRLFLTKKRMISFLDFIQKKKFVLMVMVLVNVRSFYANTKTKLIMNKWCKIKKKKDSIIFLPLLKINTCTFTHMCK